ncbi:PLP-dependent aminotransferase family protein, partial [Pseudomonas syringae pv. tagetis]
LVTLCEFYRGRRDAFERRLETHFSDLAEWNCPQGGLIFWLTLKQPLDTRNFVDAALAHDVACMPGEPVIADPDANHG